MDNLQYNERFRSWRIGAYGFKPYYKWITFNTNVSEKVVRIMRPSFKPYYKWITFNTEIWKDKPNNK